MLLSLTTTHRPATDLGYLLAKNPANSHEKILAYGTARVFFAEAGEDRCTAVLLLDIDPVALSRRPAGKEGAMPLAPYVNDRPYVASSFLSVAIARVFGSALKGRSRERQGLADQPIPLEAVLPVLPARGGVDFVRALFEPLGYRISCRPLPIDEQFPAWGDSRYVELRLSQTVRLADLLRHLYVLLPVLDDVKHYWVGEAELTKLFDAGAGWLDEHPRREQIARRYLRRDRRMVSEALRRLTDDEEPGCAEHDANAPRREVALERPIGLNERRYATVTAVLKDAGATRVLDLGCGEGKLLSTLATERWLTRIVGADVSMRALGIAAERLHLEQLPERQRERFELFQGSLLYRDRRFIGFDAITLIEVIEHLEPMYLDTVEQVLLEQTRPPILILTTPNREYNRLFAALPEGRLRHADHRFEWTRAELRGWCQAVAERRGYTVRFAPIGDEHPEYGPPTQMAVFARQEVAAT